MTFVSLLIFLKLHYLQCKLLKNKKTETVFSCQSCGYIAPRWMGKCPECESWNSFLEETREKGNYDGGASTSVSASPLSEIKSESVARLVANSSEFNRVLGGGIVPGSLILLGGDPGIGKSTLLLQEGVHLSTDEFKVLYISGEESATQTKLRANRLGIDSKNTFILAETDINSMTHAIESINPSLVIVDSIQTVHQPALESSPGTISQVRECALSFATIARKRQLPIILVGHITKDGYIAGPKALEHIVDVLLHFEGDREHLYRILRTVKNRFGSTREIGVFEMVGTGLEDVPNPSTLFLGQQNMAISGSSIVCTMEGSRPFLVEVQALVSPSNFGIPQRTATGVDSKRLSLLLAVLEKRVGLHLGAFDVFVNAAGGAKINEPSADLGVITSIASSFRDQVIEPGVLLVGEIGLGGELRPVSQIGQRIDEAEKLGFEKIYIPEQNQKGLDIKEQIKVIGISNAEQAFDEVFN